MTRGWLCILAILFLNQCGGQDITGVTVKLSPQSPIVFKPAVTLTLGGSTPTPTTSPSATTVQVKGAWFRTDMSITNSNSAAAVTFVSIHYIITGAQKGELKTFEGDMSSSDLAVTSTTEIVTVQPGFTSSPITLIIQALPTDLDNFNLSVSMKLIGYYSNPSTKAPLDRLEKSFFFNTK